MAKYLQLNVNYLQYAMNHVKGILQKNWHVYLNSWSYFKDTGVIVLVLAAYAFYHNARQINGLLEDQGLEVFRGFLFMISFLISRQNIFTYMHDRSNYFKYQNALGVRVSEYLFSWYLTCIILGLLKSLVYIAFLAIFINSTSLYRLFSPSDQLDIYIVIFLSMLSYLSLSLTFSSISSNYQIAIQLLTITEFIGFEYPLLTSWSNAFVSFYAFANPSACINIFFENIATDSSKQPLFMTQTCFGILVIQTVGFSLLYVSAENIRLNDFTLGTILAKIRQFGSSILQRHSMSEKLLSSRVSDIENQNACISIIEMKLIIEGQIILESINLQIMKGESFCIVGNNATGKSTLLKIISRLNKPTSGHIFYQPKNMEMGICLEENYLYDDLTVEQNIIFYGTIKGVPDINRQLVKILDEFELTHFCKKKYSELSGGNKRKLSLSCAFIGQSDIIILDEPTLGLDLSIKLQIWKIIEKLQRTRKQTFVIAAAEVQEEMIRLIDRVCILSNKSIKDIIIVEQLQKQRGSVCIVKSKMEMEEADEMTPENIFKTKNSTANTEQDEKIHIYIPEKIMNDCEDILETMKFANRNIDIKMKTIQEQLKSLRSNLNTELQIEKDLLQNLKNTHKQQKSLEIFLIVMRKKLWMIFSDKFTVGLYIFILLTYWVPKTLKTLQFQMSIASADDYVNHLQNISANFLFYCNFYLPIIACSQVYDKESRYQQTIFCSGMKKTPYWTANICFDIIFINLPINLTTCIVMVVYDACGGVTQVQFYQLCAIFLNSFGYSLTFITICYTISFLFTKSYIAFGSFSFIYSFWHVIPQFLLNQWVDISAKIQIFSIVFPTENLYTSLLTKQVLEPRVFDLLKLKQQENSRHYIGVSLVGINNLDHSYVFISESSFWVHILIYFIQFLIMISIFFGIRYFFFLYKISGKKAVHKAKQILTDDLVNEKNKVSEMKRNGQFTQIMIVMLYKKYSSAFVPIKGLNLALHKGEIFGLIGKNGSGKSTTIGLLTNECAKSAGNIYYDTQQIQAEDSQIYEQIGVCRQTDYIISDMTVLEHLELYSEVKGITGETRDRMIRCLLKYFEMEGMMDVKIEKLSGGSYRKLKIITTFIGNSKYLFFDEPTVGLDETSQLNFFKLLQFFAKELHSTVILVTHRIEQAELHCDRVGILIKGQLAYIERPAALLNKHKEGYIIKMRPYNFDCYDLIYKRFTAIFRILTLHKDEDMQQLVLSIPYLQMDVYRVFKLLKEQLYGKYIYWFQIKEQTLEDIFNLLVNQQYSLESISEVVMQSEASFINK